MADCESCFNYSFPPICSDCENGSNFERIVQTNADRIRAMSDEELAKFIRSVQCCSHYGDDCGYPFCHSMKGDYCNGIRDNTDEGLLEWLQSEVEE